ncbi:hypothetical protein GOY07_01620 [Wolbachia endosymbiont of Litomosoides sigmodontis]|uniref:hypothetical protein n=1 Tax=Wolbachia endosymbiont of Litomosoides sigmodontis TaxID=80850 RepID=UPI00158B276E|nr:hypothetical protein [Wolbachia endosymbiont of Litomosoides sigmodontis]QKX02911.1 hypothetical protein GOY07_01620 [Wolbachia endosymbiont of Litomosoides sigmodontis]
MNIENIQQEFFSLFDKIKKERDPIYNAMVDFNIVKSLIERMGFLIFNVAWR